MMNKVTARTLTEKLGQPPSHSGNNQKSARCFIYRASNLYAQPQKAIVCYLHAAQLLENETDPWAAKAYEQSIGCAIELIEQYNLWNQPLGYKNLSYTISYTISYSYDSYYTDASRLDRLDYSNRYRSLNRKSTILGHKNGISMTAHFPNTPSTDKLDPFIPDIGYVFAVSAHPQWKNQKNLNIHLRQSIKNSEDSYNYTAPNSIIESMTKEFIYEGLEGVFRPGKALESDALHTYEPVDPDRIPIILVHGLAASPNLWVNPIHNLIEDPLIREKYQFYTFFYPTGFPLSLNAASLKKGIRELNEYLKAKGAGSNADQMVIIGHSMGGILSSAVTRDFQGTRQEIYKQTADSLDDDTLGKESIKELLEKPPLDCVNRVIFIATPHRGSEYANNWIGRFASKFIEIPRNALAVNPAHYKEDLTSFGRSLLQIDDGMDGVQRLKFNNPVLLFNLKRPKLSHVTYHSIIGDRGFSGKLEDSSDGLVKYVSSHLDNTESELVVPAWHNAQDNDQSIEEIQRILRLHLKQ